MIRKALLVALCTALPCSAAILIEAEAFDDHGGWYLESQFVEQMGSSYLMAHGLGTPVADAVTQVDLPAGGRWRIWVRTKDWVPGHHPGRFEIHVNSHRVHASFGADDEPRWHWQPGGAIELPAGKAEIRVRDLAGFDGRFDAIYLTRDPAAPPAGPAAKARSWRRERLGLPDTPPSAGIFDVVVVGGGIPGCAATLAAARLGLRVALIQNRPMLGGNGSDEVGIPPRGQRSELTDELVRRGPDRRLLTEQVLRANDNITLFLNHHAYAAEALDGVIRSVDARHTRTNRELRFEAPVFIDTSGRAAIGRAVGADVRTGREARAEFGEFLAPAEADAMHHGHTIMFHTDHAEGPIEFPSVPWALEVARDYADLGGQTVAPGHENRDGPHIHRDDPNATMTHYWEYGQWLDPYEKFEEIRDHLFRAVYGTYANVKRLGGEEMADLRLAWLSPTLATGEWVRLMGDYIITEKDLRGMQDVHDGVAVNGGMLCLHYPGEKYDFRLGDWKFLKVAEFQVPFRALYSRNIANLMMAGKHISSSHVAGGATKFMLSGGQCGVATGAAAYLCVKYDTTPRGVYEHHLTELQDIVSGRGDYDGALRNPIRRPRREVDQEPDAD